MQSIFQEILVFLNRYAEFDPEKVTQESQLKADLGLDSLTLVCVADDAEQEFGITIDDEEMMSIRRVGDIVKIIEKHRQA